MEMKSMQLQYITGTDNGREFLDLIVPPNNPTVKDLFAAGDYTSPDSSDSAIPEESLVRLFKEAFDIDIATCTEEEWAERITIKGGTLKQWQAFTKVSRVTEVTKVKEMTNTKSLAIFIALSVVLLIGIGLLPKH